MQATEVWRLALTELDQAWPRSDCATWLQGTRIVDFQEGWIEISTPQSQAKVWLERRKRTIERVLGSILGYTVQVRLVVASSPASSPETSPDADLDDTIQIVEGYRPRRRAEKLPDVVWIRTAEGVLQVEDPVLLLVLLYLWPPAVERMYLSRSFLAACLQTTVKKIRGMEDRLAQAQGLASGNPLLLVHTNQAAKYGTGYTMLSAHMPNTVLDRRDEPAFGRYDAVGHGFLLPYFQGRLQVGARTITPYFEPNRGPQLSLFAGGLFLYLYHLCRKAAIPVAKKNPEGKHPVAPIECSQRHLEAQFHADCRWQRRQDDWAGLSRLGWLHADRPENNTRPTYIVNGPPEGLLDLIGLAAARYYEAAPVPYMEQWFEDLAAGRTTAEWVRTQAEHVGWQLTPAGWKVLAAEVQLIRPEGSG